MINANATIDFVVESPLGVYHGEPNAKAFDSECLHEISLCHSDLLGGIRKLMLPIEYPVRDAVLK
jgi:hypothetical protein